jgi:DNA polymerase III epsilon subunit-like protein
MRAESRRLGIPPPDCSHFIDTAALFKGWKLGMLKDPRETHETYARRVLCIRAAGLKYSVEACLRALGIKIDATRLHDSGQDAYLTHLIFQALWEKV